MAKMFYTLEEASQALGVAPDQVKQFAAAGKLQQFRDRDKLMFKREQVDALVTAQAGPAKGDSGVMSLSDSGGPDAIDLAADQRRSSQNRKEDPRQATGISVFDADEVAPVDPMAQTQVTQPVIDDEELALASVGSGSGLLDLTRESDDTSLGAELLDEIYPGSPEGSDLKMEGVSSTGIADSSTIEMSGPSGLSHIAEGSVPAMGMAPMQQVIVQGEAYDPAGSGMGTGMLLGVVAGLVLMGIVAASAVIGTPVTLTKTLAGNTNSLMIFVVVLLIASLILGGVGFGIGLATGKRR